MDIVYRIVLLSLLLADSVVGIGQTGIPVYDQNRPIGWATMEGGTTGSADQNHVVVTSMNGLIVAMQGSTPRTIYVKGILTTKKAINIQNASNKTIYGLPGSALVNAEGRKWKYETGVLFFRNCENIILRNLTFRSAGAYDIDGNDNLCLLNSRHIWVDHCDFQDGVDGNFDCVEGSDLICVSWCRFRYLIPPMPGGSGGADDHRFCCLWGNDENKAHLDSGHLRTTFVNCWWDEGCVTRMPAVRYGTVHVLNCYYTSSVATRCISSSMGSNICVEGCYFDAKKPWGEGTLYYPFTDYNILMTANNYGVKALQQRVGDADYFIPSEVYDYTLFPVLQVPFFVSAGAGATLSISENENYGTSATAIMSPTLSDRVVRSMYVGLDGRMQKNGDGRIGIRTDFLENGEKKSKIVVSK